MQLFNEQQRQSIHRNCNLAIDYLEARFRKNRVHLQELPSYYYQGNKSKLEITVYPNPRIAKIGIRIIGFKDYEREPAFESSYDLDGFSLTNFQREIEDLISRMD